MNWETSTDLFGSYSFQFISIASGIGLFLKVLTSSKTLERFKAIRELRDYFRDFKQQIVSEDRQVQARRIEELEKEFERLSAARESDLASFTAQLKAVQESTQLQHEYIVWATGYVHAVEIWAAKNGLTLPPPPFLTFSEWESLRKK